MRNGYGRGLMAMWYDNMDIGFGLPVVELIVGVALVCYSEGEMCLVCWEGRGEWLDGSGRRIVIDGVWYVNRVMGVVMMM